jgi:hypothetical protein
MSYHDPDAGITPPPERQPERPGPRPEFELRILAWLASRPEQAPKILAGISDDAFTKESRLVVESLRQGKAIEIPAPPATEEEALRYLRGQALGLLTRDAGRATKTGSIEAVSRSYERVVRLVSALEPPVREQRGGRIRPPLAARPS